MKLMKKTLIAVTAMGAMLCATVAQAVVVDDFSAAPGAINVSGGAAGGDQWLVLSDGGIAGGQRQLHARDGHSGSLGNPTALKVDAGGYMEWWGGSSAPDNYVRYGSVISGDGGGTPSDLNINALLTDNFEIDILQQPADTNMGIFSITLYTGTDGGGSGGSFSYNTGTQPAAGTLSVALSNFGAITAQDAADIDGIKVQTSASYWNGSSAISTPEGGGVQIGSISVGASVPEPSSFVLAGLGLMGLVGFGLRRRKR